MRVAANAARRAIVFMLTEWMCGRWSGEWQRRCRYGSQWGDDGLKLRKAPMGLGRAAAGQLRARIIRI